MTPLPVITGLGFVTSIGHDRATVLRNLRELRHGFEPVEFFDNPSSVDLLVGQPLQRGASYFPRK